MNDDFFNFVSNLFTVNCSEVTDTGDNRFENLVLSCFPKTFLNIFPEIIHKPTIIRYEVSQSGHQIKAITFYAV